MHNDNTPQSRRDSDAAASGITRRQWLQGALALTAAGGIALVSSLGNLGPSVSPSIATWLVATTGTPTMGLYLVVVMWILCGLSLMAVVRPRAVGAGIRTAAA